MKQMMKTVLEGKFRLGKREKPLLLGLKVLQ
jgi:hypothetical protein